MQGLLCKELSVLLLQLQQIFFYWSGLLLQPCNITHLILVLFHFYMENFATRVRFFQVCANTQLPEVLTSSGKRCGP